MRSPEAGQSLNAGRDEAAHEERHRSLGVDFRNTGRSNRTGFCCSPFPEGVQW